MKQQPQRRRRRAPKREEVSTTHVRKGIFFLMILLGVVSFCAVAGMLVKLMLVDHDYYEAKAIRNQTRSTSVTASRGTIYDRNGNVLAASSSVENVFLDPLELSQNKVDVPALAKKLAAVLDLDAGWIEEQAADTSLRYKVIKRRQAQEVCDKVREIIAEDKIIGVHLEPDSQRYYPYHDVAAQIIGFMLSSISIYGLFKMYAIISFAVPFLVLGLPIFDICFAVIRRVSKGQSPMHADRGHVHHRLIDMGFSQKQAVAIAYMLSAILGMAAVVLTNDGEMKALIFIGAVIVVGAIGVLVIFHRHPDKQDETTEKPEEKSHEEN